MLTHIFGEDIFIFPDWNSAYSLCGKIRGNFLYGETSCFLRISNIDEPLPVITATIINVLLCLSFLFLFKDYLNSKQRILFAVLLIIHPYLIINMPRFYSDLFGSVGILLITYFSLKQLKMNIFFFVSALFLLHMRNALIPVFIIYSIIEIIKEYIHEKKISIIPCLLLISSIVSLSFYSGYIESFFMDRSSGESDSISLSSILLRLILLLGFREEISNQVMFGDGFFQGPIEDASLYLISQIIISFFLVLIHSFGLIFSSKKLLLKNISFISIYFYFLPTLLKGSFIRFLVPLLPIILFGLCLRFFMKKDSRT